MATVSGSPLDPSVNTNIDPTLEADNISVATDILDIDEETQLNLRTQTVPGGTSAVTLTSSTTGNTGVVVNMTGGSDDTVTVDIDENDTVDTIFFTGSSNIRLDLPSGSETGSVRAVLADGRDTVVGGPGNHVVFGGLADDSLDGGLGNDLLLGNQGDDLIASTTGSDSMYGGQGNDQITAGQDDDFVFGNRDDDLLFGNDGNDLIYGGQGNDMVSGGENTDTIWGGTGDDSVSGIQGDDFVDGGEGNDTLHGGAGNDTLKGGDGDDLLSGAENADLYLFNGLFGDDTVAGLIPSEDTIRLDVNDPTNDWSVESIDDLAGLISSDASGNAVLTLGSQSITLLNVTADDVKADLSSYFSLFGVSRPMRD